LFNSAGQSDFNVKKRRPIKVATETIDFQSKELVSQKIIPQIQVKPQKLKAKTLMKQYKTTSSASIILPEI
jgi:hypothetical protein